jgi:hypothetical protein
MGGKQLGFGYYEQSTAKKCNMGMKFLAEQQQVVPWKVLIDLMKPHYPKTNSMGSRPCLSTCNHERIHKTSATGATINPTGLKNSQGVTPFQKVTVAACG